MKKFAIVLPKGYIGQALYLQKGCQVLSPYSLFPKSRPARKARSILFRHLKDWTFGLNPALKSAADVYIIYDSVSPVVAAYIRKHRPDARIIAYYINPVKYSYPVEEYTRSNCELWSFDESDAQQYGMQWNPLHYFGTVIDKEREREFDVAFIGADKGRYDYLKELEAQMQNMQLRTDIHITPSSDFPFYDRDKYRPRLSYEENIRKVLNATAILDIMQPGQTGYTMRIPESMVNHIKLITNNSKTKEYSFYSEDNIFILGERPLETLPEFLRKPWDHSHDREILNLEYDYWIAQFGI